MSGEMQARRCSLQNCTSFLLTGTLRKIWIEDGVRGFYRGLGPTIFGYLPTWAIYFTVYDKCKSVLASSLSECKKTDMLEVM